MGWTKRLCILLVLFDCIKKQHWLIGFLIGTQQFLKEILNELCVYNKRGANQGTYELKPEYKKSAEDAGAE